MPLLTGQELLTVPLFLTIAYLYITITIFIHEALHILAAQLTNTEIVNIHRSTNYLIPHIQLEINTPNPRATRVVALYPTLIATAILIYIVLFTSFSGWIDFILKMSVILFGLPSYQDLHTAVYPQ